MLHCHNRVPVIGSPITPSRDRVLPTSSAPAHADRTIERVRRHGVTPAEVNDSKRALAAAVPRRMETNTESAAVLADAEFYGHGIDYPEKLPDLIRAVTKTEVEEAAERYLTLGRHVLVVAGPTIDKETLR